MKYHGKIGFVTTEEKRPGVDVEVVTEREYFGDVIKASKRWESASQVNPNLNISNQISIIADPYLGENLFAIRYISWMNSLWDITSVDVQYPRMVLTIGGVYNGTTPGPTDGVRGSDGSECTCQVPTSSRV